MSDPKKEWCQKCDRSFTEYERHDCSMKARIAELEASVDLLHSHTYLDRCGCHWCIAARAWSKEKAAFSERVAQLSGERDNLLEQNKMRGEYIGKLHEALDKMVDLVDSACTEARYFGPRADSNDGKGLNLVLGEIRGKADELARKSDVTRQITSVSDEKKDG